VKVVLGVDRHSQALGHVWPLSRVVRGIVPSSKKEKIQRPGTDLRREKGEVLVTLYGARSCNVERSTIQT